MPKRETVFFEVRHTQDMDYLRTFYLHTLSRSPLSVILWLVLAGVSVWLAVRNAGEETMGMMIACIVVALLCLYCGFVMGFLKIRKSHRTAARAYGKDSWESVLRIGDEIEIIDDGRGSAHVKWEDCAVLSDQGGWLVLRFRGGLGNLGLRKSDFVKGNAAEFVRWMAEEHPEIPQSR